MSFQNDLVEFAKQEYSFLGREYGFNQHIVSKEGYSTTIDFLEKNLAIELEFEWREFCVFLLVVQLANGELPKGHYIYLGKKVRLPLIQIVEERNWPVDKNLIVQIKQIGHKKRVNLLPDDLKAQVNLYNKLLRSCINKILEEGVNLFN